MVCVVCIVCTWYVSMFVWCYASQLRHGRSSRSERLNARLSRVGKVQAALRGGRARKA